MSSGPPPAGSVPKASRQSSLPETSILVGTSDGEQSHAGYQSISQEHSQRGVEQVEAITAAWTRKSLIMAYAAIFVVFYVSSLQQQINGNLSIYVTSSFAEHPLTATTSIVSSIVGAVAKLPIARVIDTWGRTEGYVAMIVLSTLGLIMMATCYNVQTYAAAQVFYFIGFDGIAYVLDVTMADTSSLKNRAWLFAFSTCPYIVNTFAGPAAAQQFLKHASWRWGYGSFAIITPLVCLPLVVIFVHNRRKAVRLGYISEDRGRDKKNKWRAALRHVTEFDVVGIIFLCAAFASLLLPLSVASSVDGGWRSTYIMIMVILGVVLFVVFLLWERYLAPVGFVPFHLLVDRTVLGGCLLSSTLFASFYCWDVYLTSYLQVVHDLSVSEAGYIFNIYSIGACVFSLLVGFVIRATGNFKYVAMAALPVQFLGTAMMIYARSPGRALGYVILCQILIALSGGTMVICQQIAVMAAAAHFEVAIGLALLGLFSKIGAAVGQTLAAAIYTHAMPRALYLHLPDYAKSEAMRIYSSIHHQLEYPMGSEIRQAIIQAYGDVMRQLCIAGLLLLPTSVVCVLVWRNINVKTVKQVKGTVV